MAIRRSHVGKSLYFYQLAAWFEVIPRDLIKVVLFESYLENSSAHLRELLEFVGVDPVGQDAAGTYMHTSRSKKRRGGSTIELPRSPDPTNEEALRELFRPHNRLLDDLLGYETGY